jgi:predicted aspartyl protease
MRSSLRLALLALLAAVPAAAQRPVVEAAFDSPANLIVVEGRIGGSRPLWFILDTGAQRTVINAAVVDSLGVELGDEGTATGSAGQSSMRWIPRATIRLGDVELRVDSAVSIALSSLEPALGHRIDGILGHSVFAQYVVEVDYAADTVRLYRPDEYRPDPAARAVPLRIADEHAMVDAELFVGGQPVAGTFLLDTGASSELSLNAPFVRQHRLLERVGATTGGGAVMGVGGTSQSRSGTLDSLRIGGFTLAGPGVSMSMDTAGALAQDDRAGIMGAEVFRRFRVTLDYPRSRMLLVPTPALTEPFRQGRSGLAVIARGAEFDDLVVAAVQPGSAGEAAGFRPGDQIVSVDGWTPANLDSIRDMLRVPGARITLTVRRGTETLQLLLALPGG